METRLRARERVARLPDRSAENVARNRAYYSDVYRLMDRAPLVETVKRWHAFLDDATVTDTSWVGLYRDGLRNRLAGKRVLELGPGDGLNALIMAALGAEVVALDISPESAALIRATARELQLSERVEAISGDFSQLPLGTACFDLVVGKVVLHHLTHEQEALYLRQAARVLRDGGEARFLEPAVNSVWLERLRWLTPVPGRPSVLQRNAFRQWQAQSPHPERDNSSAHFREVAGRYFRVVEIVPLGCIERLHRLLPVGERNRAFRRWALRVEQRLPRSLQMWGARSQTLVLREPRLDGFRR